MCGRNKVTVRGGEFFRVGIWTKSCPIELARGIVRGRIAQKVIALRFDLPAVAIIIPKWSWLACDYLDRDRKAEPDLPALLLPVPVLGAWIA